MDTKIHTTGISQKIRDTLKELTLEEKVALLSGKDFVSMAGIPRLSLPALKMADSTSAVRGSDFHASTPTCCFPNTTALAATWNKGLIEEMGKVVAGQARYKGVNIILRPTVNIHRDPRGGRNFESFSEDPTLTAHVAAALVRRIQNQGMGTCIKHFVCNESETGRRKYDSIVDERTLREIYMFPFQWLVRECQPTAIMTAYNKINGIYSCETPLIQDVLRKEWAFKGLVMSDWFGTISREAALEAGLDLEMPGPSLWRGNTLLKDINSARISEDIIDVRVLEILKLIERTSQSNPKQDEECGLDDVASAMARQVASESMILLKNDSCVLPLNMNQAPNIAVIGATSIKPVCGGGSAAGVPQYIQRPYDYIQQAHPNPYNVHLSLGVKTHDVIPIVPVDKTRSKNGMPGVDIVYWNNGDEQPALVDCQEHAHMVMLGQVKPGLSEYGFRYKISTTLVAESTGVHTIAIQCTGDFKLFVDGEEVLAAPAPDITTEDFLFEPSRYEYRTSIAMIASQPYSILLRARSRARSSNGEPTPHSAKICFLEQYSDFDAIQDASMLASTCDVSIIFAGRNAEFESEGFDLEHLNLPGAQEEMIRSVAKSSKKTVVLLYGGNPFDVSSWVEDVDAVLFAHYPGQEGAAALVDILTGVISPSGKLSTTWPRSLEDVPTYGSFPCRPDEEGNMLLEYSEHCDVGYRYYWQNGNEGKARWDFGYGLSYTNFEYGNLRTVLVNEVDVSKDAILEAKVEVKNVGSVASYEVVQVYVSNPARPTKELIGFEKVFLRAGEEQTVKVRMVEKYALGSWNLEGKTWRVGEGMYKVHVRELQAEVLVKEGWTWSGV